jgi:sporulation protein YlmC with PRC-barrel domain
MKKFTLLSVFIILALALVACAPEDTDPGVGTPGIPDTGETPAPGLVTPDPMVTPMVPQVTPMETPVVTPPTDAPVQTPVATPVTGVEDFDPEDDPNRASNLLGVRVENLQGETLGDVDDLIIRVQEEQIVYAIIGRGGLLGLGEDHIAVPYDALTLQREADDADDYFFVLDVTEEAWDNAPTVNLNEIHLGRPGWDVNFDATWVRVTPGTQQQPGTTPATPAQPGTTPATPAQPGTVTAMELDAVRLTRLLGANVYDRQETGTQTLPATPAQPGQPGTPATPATPAQPGATTVDWVTLGEIEEVIVNAETGEVRYVVVDVNDNELNLRDVWIAVPMASIQLVRDLDDDDLDAFDYDYWVMIDRQRLAGAPTFESGMLPDTRSPQWDQGIRGYWGTQDQ